MAILHHTYCGPCNLSSESFSSCWFNQDATTNTASELSGKLASDTTTGFMKPLWHSDADGKINPFSVRLLH